MQTEHRREQTCYRRSSDALLCLQDATCADVGGCHWRRHRHHYHQGLRALNHCFKMYTDVWDESSFGLSWRSADWVQPDTFKEIKWKSFCFSTCCTSGTPNTPNNNRLMICTKLAVCEALSLFCLSDYLIKLQYLLRRWLITLLTALL